MLRGLTSRIQAETQNGYNVAMRIIKKSTHFDWTKKSTHFDKKAAKQIQAMLIILRQ